jgi:hypothetical protein
MKKKRNLKRSSASHSFEDATISKYYADETIGKLMINIFLAQT